MKNPSHPYLYSILCVLQPVLYIYLSPLPGVDLGTFLVLLSAFFLMSGRRPFRLPGTFLCVLAYSVLITVLNLIPGGVLYSSARSVIFRTARFVIVMAVMIGWGYRNCFDRTIFLKVLRTVSLIVAGYAIVQFMVHGVAGIRLPNVFGPIKGDNMNMDISYAYRPPSIFPESSHVAYFLTPYLCHCLFCGRRKKSRKEWAELILISSGILVTTSGQGLLVLALCWAIWFLSNIRQFNVRSLLTASVFVIAVLCTFDLSFTVERLFYTDEMNAVDARRIGYDLLKELPPVYKVFGTGFGNYDDTVYYSSFAEIIFCTGYVGLALVLLFYAVPFFKGRVFHKSLVISTIVLMIGGGVYTVSILCLYMPILLTVDWDAENRV